MWVDLVRLQTRYRVTSKMHLGVSSVDGARPQQNRAEKGVHPKDCKGVCYTLSRV